MACYKKRKEITNILDWLATLSKQNVFAGLEPANARQAEFPLK